MVFSDSVNNLGIVEQTRQMMRVDAAQYPTYRIVNSVNNYLDTVTGYAIGADRRFQFDDTNHTKLPIGTTDLTATQSDYSFLTDEQGNSIINLTRIDILDDNGDYRKMEAIDQAQINVALDEFLKDNGDPILYDKIADNIIRLYPTPDTSVTAGLKFYFQRTPSYFVATDTTKEPGVSPLLHRGFVMAAAFDGALSLGLQNLQPLSVERQVEEEKMKQYFAVRNTDETSVMMPPYINAE
jgi:hypothetical protein